MLRRLGVTDAEGRLEVEHLELFGDLDTVRFRPDLWTESVRPVDRARTQLTSDPVDLVVPAHGRVEVLVLGPDERPWPSTWSMGGLIDVSNPGRPRLYSLSDCDPDGRCRFLVAADGSAFNFELFPYGFSAAPFSFRRFLWMDDPFPDRDPLHLRTPLEPGQTTRVTFRVDPGSCLVTGHVSPAVKPSGRNWRPHLQSDSDDGRTVNERLEWFPDGSFLALLESAPRGPLRVLTDPSYPPIQVAHPGLWPIDEAHRIDLGSLEWEALPTVAQGSLQTAKITPSPASKWTVQHQLSNGDWVELSAASVLRREERVEVRAQAPLNAPLRLIVHDPNLSTSVTLPIGTARGAMSWDLRHLSILRVTVEETQDLLEAPVLMRRSDQEVLEGATYVASESGFASARFAGLEPGRYTILQRAGARGDPIPPQNTVIDIGPGMERSVRVPARR